MHKCNFKVSLHIKGNKMISIRVPQLDVYKCRNCNHWHSWINCKALKKCTKVNGCECSEFVPSDNLEFLEYKYERREII